MQFFTSVFARANGACERIIHSKVTLAYFLLAFIHCFAQGLVLSFIYSADAQSSDLTSSILYKAQVPKNLFGWLSRSGGTYDLQLCDAFDHSPRHCEMVIASENMTVQEDFRSVIKDLSRSKDMHPAFNSSGGVDGVILGLPGNNEPLIFLSSLCTRVLVYPNQVFDDMQKEDVTLIAVQFWLLSISFIALMYDSIPHIISVLGVRMLVTGWSVFSIWRTMDSEHAFRSIISSNGSPCKVDLFPGYFKTRMSLEIADFALNCISLLICGLLSSRLLWTYSAETTKRVGTSKEIMRMYRLFMTFLVCIHISVFSLVTSTILWVEHLMYSAITSMTPHGTFYKAIAITTAVLLLPWLLGGWFAVHREHRVLMLGFITLAFIFISCWAIMFSSQVYRWMFIQLPFMTCITVESFVVLIASVVSGVLCLFNFGKGLGHYLYVEDVLQSMHIEPQVFPHNIGDSEKSQQDELDLATLKSPIAV